MDAYVARQPIFDLKKKIFGYKLLFRDQTAMYDPGIDGDVATSTVLSNSFFPSVWIPLWAPKVFY